MQEIQLHPMGMMREIVMGQGQGTVTVAVAVADAAFTHT